MIKVLASFIHLALFTIVALGVAATTVHADTTEPEIGQYADVGDIRMYYESRGEGVPLMVLNGGFQTAEDYQFLIPHFADGFRLILIDHRGRGRSNDGKGPMTYNRIAHDVVLLLDQLQIGSAHFVGHSEGGAVALELLINYSDRVRTAMLIGTPLTVSEANRKWFDTEPVATKEKRFEDAVSVAGKMYKTYQRLAPDPSRWPIVMDKMYGGGSAQPTYSANMLGSITRPVLVIKTEHDQFYGPEIFDQTAKSIADAEIFSIPEGKHNVPMTHPEQVTGAIRDFVARRGAGPVSAISEKPAR